MENILLAISTSLISGLLGVIIANNYYKKLEKTKLKTETFRKILGYRYCLTLNSSDDEYNEFFSALNEVFLVFNDNDNVINALKKMHEELSIPNRLNDNLVSLIKEISKVLNIDCSKVNDSFFETPFTKARRN